ncbi:MULTISPECIES: carbon-nitrogen hydrolase family protein [Gluconobacter]|uniref:carbon-nitrogen hydrolase family protein n=1 Tax=Gluconobacter TaxID=441 RepID=UPI0039E96F45
MLVTLIQFNAGNKKDENIATVRRLVADAFSRQKSRVISLPEMWPCRNADRPTRFQVAEILPAPDSGATGGEVYQTMANLAREYGAYVHGGSIAELDGERLCNTTLVFNPEGQEIARYRKLHLFDVTGPDGTVYNESRDFNHGKALSICDIDGIKAGFTICYDLRFPELFRALRDEGAEVIFLPAAFTLQTGKDHWEVLLRARAIENQVWIVATGMYGSHRNDKGEIRTTFGHSLICDPWGHIVAMASDGETSVTGYLDHALTQRIRQSIPLGNHRRLPLPLVG